jgi:hypothetical protein
MPISTILDVAIALVFVYFLLALIASGLQELIAGFFAWRGTYLSKAIDVILDNSPSASFRWVNFGDFWKAHFTSGAGQTALDRLNAEVEKNPSGAMTPAQKVLAKVLDVHTHPLMRSTPSTLPSYVPARNFAMVMLDVLRDGSQSPLIEQVENTISALPDGDLKRTLLLFLTNAGGDIDRFREHVETWFDDAMARLSGIYTRLSQYVLLILGLIIAPVLNVDSIHLTRVLYESPPIRAAAVASATANTLTPPATAPTPPSATAPTARGTATTPDGDQKGGKAKAPQDEQPNIKAAWTQVQDLEKDELPFGWDFSHGFWANFKLSTVPGWLITAAAIAFGAPFWFSLLQSLINIRNAGPAPKRADGTTSG